MLQRIVTWWDDVNLHNDGDLGNNSVLAKRQLAEWNGGVKASLSVFDVSLVTVVLVWMVCVVVPVGQPVILIGQESRKSLVRY